MKHYTFYDLWRKGKDGYTNQGSFDTSLLRTYQLADAGNQAKLKKAFPHLFEKIVESVLVEATSN